MGNKYSPKLKGKSRLQAGSTNTVSAWARDLKLRYVQDKI